jgi:hypothetical protein
MDKRGDVSPERGGNPQPYLTIVPHAISRRDRRKVCEVLDLYSLAARQLGREGRPYFRSPAQYFRPKILKALRNE